VPRTYPLETFASSSCCKKIVRQDQRPNGAAKIATASRDCLIRRGFKLGFILRYLFGQG
jgi:hypothetical protein